MKTAAQLAADILVLGPDHRLAVHEMQMIEKAVEGAGKYGALNLETDPRDFLVEAMREGLDREWYMLIELAKRGIRIGEMEQENAELKRQLAELQRALDRRVS